MVQTRAQKKKKKKRSKRTIRFPSFERMSNYGLKNGVSAPQTTTMQNFCLFFILICFRLIFAKHSNRTCNSFERPYSFNRIINVDGGCQMIYDCNIKENKSMRRCESTTHWCIRNYLRKLNDPVAPKNNDKNNTKWTIILMAFLLLSISIMLYLYLFPFAWWRTAFALCSFFFFFFKHSVLPNDFRNVTQLKM